MDRETLLAKLDEKFAAMGQDTNVHLEGLLHNTPITYWDYIQTDALLNLQIQRTNLPDEMVFIMYHQVNELLFKMILWEMDQIADNQDLTPEFFTEHLSRISRYFDVLANSFEIMGDGMEVAQYMKFRNTLTPASGFQSAQYRLIEFSSTEIINLIDARFKMNFDIENKSFEEIFENLYWQAAGKDFKTGEKSTLLNLFEKRYKAEFLRYIEDYQKKNLWTRFKELPEEAQNNIDLRNAMRHYDHTVNVKWVMAHYNAAGKYLLSGDEDVEATGGSDWRKYMHPKYQRRIFFPTLWTEEEHKNWGITNLESYEILK
ncbi:tryptophan 2,3-dioxygenase family protein [Aureivirga sp. CE67]|uniref:tryptophan 2,3-dioxygenase family protein n=1 Tax=Aureivirga sp. CE67 TaxID=1788983 RepID=UPI0018CAD0B9|nr:tryptophan 2,3-dioxygenase family protein [Aureivirga sp. CE67]